MRKIKNIARKEPETRNNPFDILTPDLHRNMLLRLKPDNLYNNLCANAAAFNVALVPSLNSHVFQRIYLRKYLCTSELMIKEIVRQNKFLTALKSSLTTHTQPKKTYFRKISLSKPISNIETRYAKISALIKLIRNNFDICLKQILEPAENFFYLSLDDIGRLLFEAAHFDSLECFILIEQKLKSYSIMGKSWELADLNQPWQFYDLGLDPYLMLWKKRLPYLHSLTEVIVDASIQNRNKNSELAVAKYLFDTYPRLHPLIRYHLKSAFLFKGYERIERYVLAFKILGKIIDDQTLKDIIHQILEEPLFDEYSSKKNIRMRNSKGRKFTQEVQHIAREWRTGGGENSEYSIFLRASAFGGSLDAISIAHLVDLGYLSLASPECGYQPSIQVKGQNGLHKLASMWRALLSSESKINDFYKACCTNNFKQEVERYFFNANGNHSGTQLTPEDIDIERLFKQLMSCPGIDFLEANTSGLNIIQILLLYIEGEASRKGIEEILGLFLKDPRFLELNNRSMLNGSSLILDAFIGGYFEFAKVLKSLKFLSGSENIDSPTHLFSAHGVEILLGRSDKYCKKGLDLIIDINQKNLMHLLFQSTFPDHQKISFANYIVECHFPNKDKKSICDFLNSKDESNKTVFHYMSPTLGRHFMLSLGFSSDEIPSEFLQATPIFSSHSHLISRLRLEEADESESSTEEITALRASR